MGNISFLSDLSSSLSLSLSTLKFISHIYSILKMNTILSLILFASAVGFTLGGEWTLQSSELCFGATKNTFGTFRLENGGKLSAIKLEYVKGYVSCNKDMQSCRSRWGCDCFPHDYISVFITDSGNQILFPTSIKPTDVWYPLPGFKSTSDAIIFRNKLNPVDVSAGDELKVWYGEDLRNHTPENNEGTVCARVSVKLQ